MKKRKSITGFVLGLLGSLGILGISAGSTLLSGLLSDFGANANTFSILSWLMLAGSIIGIVGASLCFTKARAGGLLLLVATGTAGGFFGYIIKLLIDSGLEISNSLITTMVFTMIPVALVFIGAIAGLSAKSVKIKRYRYR